MDDLVPVSYTHLDVYKRQTPLEQKTKMNIIELEGNNIMNILARSVLEM